MRRFTLSTVQTARTCLLFLDVSAAQEPNCTIYPRGAPSGEWVIQVAHTPVCPLENNRVSPASAQMKLT